jgi:cytochrome c oxidase cbb3-type subunit 3
MSNFLRASVFGVIVLVGVALGPGAPRPSAQQPPGQPPSAQGTQGPQGAGRGTVPAGGQGRGGGRGGAQFDQEAVDRGEQVLVQHCGFCHGANARGGSSGPDLLRSDLVLNDENGKQLGDFLKVGRPDKGMPRVDLADGDVSSLATFLHSRVAAVANRGAYKILDILTGDPQAGAAYFNGAGKCSSCHSPTGDLQGIGAKYDPVTLQERIIMPRGRGGRGGRGAGGGGARGGAAGFSSTQPIVTVTLPSGESYSGAMLRLTDFDVMLRDQSGQTRSWLRNGDSPKVVLTDPLQAHVALLTKWTDVDMRNMTAYLASLK